MARASNGGRNFHKNVKCCSVQHGWLHSNHVTVVTYERRLTSRYLCVVPPSNRCRLTLQMSYAWLKIKILISTFRTEINHEQFSVSSRKQLCSWRAAEVPSNRNVGIFIGCDGREYHSIAYILDSMTFLEISLHPVPLMPNRSISNWHDGCFPLSNCKPAHAATTCKNERKRLILHPENSSPEHQRSTNDLSTVGTFMRHTVTQLCATQLAALRSCGMPDN